MSRSFGGIWVISFPFNSSFTCLPVEYTWQTCRGYCMSPHHFGLGYEGKAHGMHINYLTDHRDLDELTGNAKWRYTPCRVEKIQEV